MNTILVFVGLFAICAQSVNSATVPKDQDDCGPEVEDLPATPDPLDSVPGEYDWVTKNAATIPYKCQFVYGGGYNRLLYVGRVRVDGDVLPAPIHHYGRGGTETVHYNTQDGVVISKDIPVEWLCAKGRVGWIRVPDLTKATIEKSSAIAVGYDSVERELLYGCLVHSFYSAQYPAALGTVVNGSCVFESNGEIVSSRDFNFWYSLELLVSL